MSTVLVVGAGAWGSALANVCARAGTRTFLWDGDAELMAQLTRTRHHPRFVPEVAFAAGIEPLSDPALAGAVDCLLLVVPFQVMARAWTIRRARRAGAAVACASRA